MTVTPLWDSSNRWLGAAVIFRDATEAHTTKAELEQVRHELESSNEELETMNEKLESANAELQSINNEMRQQTEELDRANGFLESILASSKVGVVVIDHDFSVLLWNDRAGGLRADEVRGKSLLGPDIGLPVQKLREPIEHFLTAKGDKKQKVTLDATNRRGQAIRCSVTQTTRRDASGRPKGIVLLMEEQRQ